MHRDHINLGASVPNVRGRARVQLFDARTGALSLDVARDNFVSERWLRAMAWYANWGAFSNDTTNTSLNTTMHQASAFREIPFAGIALTDYDGAPDQAERLVRGKPLAHASKGVAGGGDYRGTYNADESTHQFAYHKFVYDFATSQANGTFQSIYTGPFNSSARTAPSSLTASRPALNSVARTADVWLVRTSTGDLLQCETGQVSTVLDWSPLAFGSAPTLGATTAITPAADNPATFCEKDGRLYWLTAYASQARQIVSAPLSNLANVRTEKTLDATWAQTHGGTAAGAFYVTGLTYHPLHQKFYISVSSSGVGRPTFAIMSLDPDTLADGDKWGAEGDIMYSALTAYPGETNLVTQSRSGSNPKAQHVQLEGDGSITIAHQSNSQIMPYGDSDIGAASGAGNNHQNQWSIAPAQHFFSRALLDQPVEKTSQNTMKITYEFTFDEPVLP